jgi:hypothetical protein
MIGGIKMNKLNMAKIIKDVQKTVTAHSPEILTGIGVAGTLITTVLAVKATPKALKLIEAEKKARNVDKLSALDTVKVAWKHYVPAAVTCVTSIACIVGASSVSVRRNAALAAAYKVTETALTEYKDKVVEVVGEKKEQAIRDAIDKDHVEKNPVSKSEVIITDKGNTLCMDYLSGRYFKSDIDKIKAAVNVINRRMVVDMYVSLNEFYDELGLDHTRLGDELGWKLEKGLLDVDFGSQIADDGTPCIVVNYSITPEYGYDEFM